MFAAQGLDQAQALSSFLPRILGAVAVLVAGWLAAMVIAAGVRAAVRRTGLTQKVSGMMKAEGPPPGDAERIIGKAVYYLVMLFVIVGFLQVLGLELITEPLNALLNQLLVFAPRIVGAAILTVAAWILATLLRTFIVAALGTRGISATLRSGMGVPPERESRVGETVGNAVYWLIFLIFLPAILGTLAVEGLLSPVRGVVDQALGFLPNLAAAAILFFVGWVAARLVRAVVTNVLAAVGVDGLSERVGVDRALGSKKLSELLGLIAYVFILIPVAIGSLQALELDAVTAPASEMLRQILAAVPMVFAAAFLLVIAYFVARLVSGLLKNVLAGAGVDSLPARLGLRPPEGGEHPSLSGIVATLALVGIMLFAAIEASALMGFDELASLISGFLVFAGQIALGIVILGIGLAVANLAAAAVRASGTPQAGMLAVAARVSIIVLAGAMALGQMGLASDIINIAFGFLVGSVAVAAALAFGLGSRELAGAMARDWVGRLSAGGSPESEAADR